MKPKINTDYPIHPLLENRWSPRAFAGKSVEKEKLYQLFEAARWAASCLNGQPWHFLVANQENAEGFEQLGSVLLGGNLAWATKAPVLMLVVAKTTFENGKPNKHAFYDVGLAMGNLSMQATELGLYLHQMAGFDAEKAKEVFKLPPDFEPVVMVALGYLGNAETLEEPFRERETAPQVRKKQNTFVFGTTWNESL